jgi:hypothetical protein
MGRCMASGLSRASELGLLARSSPSHIDGVWRRPDLDRRYATQSGHTRRLSYKTRKCGLVDDIQCVFGPLTTAMPQLHHISQPP